MSKLSAEISTTQDGRIIIEPGYVDYLRNQGYIIEEIEEVHSVESNSRDMSHLVVRIATYDKPRDRYDALDDMIGLWVCSCEDFQYNQSADVSEDMVKPSDSGTCRHIRSVDMVEQAKQDDNQTELIE
jgi:hypothetical protein